jgi:hypothetical protein
MDPHSDTPSGGVIAAVAAPASNCFSGIVTSGRACTIVPGAGKGGEGGEEEEIAKCKLQNANFQFAFCNLHFAITLSAPPQQFTDSVQGKVCSSA